MSATPLLRRAWRKQYAIPSEHGSWIWWIGPMLIGAAASGRAQAQLAILFLTVLAAFLLRQPATIAVKAWSGRRPRRELAPALIWLALYLAAALAGLFGLVTAGHPELLLLAIPGLPVFAWHLWLISRREERGQPGVEIIAAGVLALAAPAAYWVAGGPDQRTAWLLWGLTWFQAAASIVYVHLRLRQRRMEVMPTLRERWSLGTRALVYAGFNVLASLALLGVGWIPPLVPVAFVLMLLDTLEGVARPAHAVRPATIGLRQLGMSSLFVLLLAAAYLLRG